MASEHEFDCVTRRLQRRIAQRVLFEHRREASSDEQRIALAQRHVEQLREMQHHFAAGVRAAGFQKTQVLRRNLRFDCEVQLAHAPALPPFAQQIADRTCSGDGSMHAHVHGATIAQLPLASPLPAR
jgi:hypothetical protein